jgi:hypothetical protein
MERHGTLMTSRLFGLAAALTTAFTALAAPALAAAPIQEGYDPQGVAQTDIANSHGSGTLPFTGLDLVLVVAVGLALIAVGVTMSRLLRRG